MEGLRVLVTGGCGFIGSYIVDHLLEAYEDIQVLNIDKMTYAAREENVTRREDPRYRLAKVDICDIPALRAEFIVFNPNFVIHAAAESHVGNSIENSRPFISTNIEGTVNLLELARETGGVINFHYVSTDEVYGDRKIHLFRETDILDPRNPYSASKAAAEGLVRAYSNTHGIAATITRGCNSYGPRQHGEKFTPIVVRSLRKGFEVPLHGDGKHEREWIHAEDHARAIVYVALEIITEEEEWGVPVYNIGSGDILTNQQYVGKIAAAMDLPFPTISVITDRAGNDRRYGVEFSKITAAGFSPIHTLEEGLADTARNLDVPDVWITSRQDG